MAAGDHRKMQQAVARQERGARDRRGPPGRPPGARGETEPGCQESDADVLNQMGVEGAGIGGAGNQRPPDGTG